MTVILWCLKPFVFHYYNDCNDAFFLLFLQKFKETPSYEYDEITDVTEVTIGILPKHMHVTYAHIYILYTYIYTPFIYIHTLIQGIALLSVCCA